MATYNSDGSVSDINAKIAAASDGDTVTFPNANFTVGAGGTHIDITKAVVFKGLGASSSLTMSASGPSGSAGVIRILAAGAIVQDFATIPASNVAVFSVSAQNFHISNITHNQAFSSATGYFAFINSVYGLIDLCNITGSTGTNELIYVRGPSDAWQNPSGIGDENCVFIERNTFNGPGYVCDVNSNGKATVRFNTITGGMKVDGHGLASNGAPPSFRGCRRLEVYCNTHTYNASSGWTAWEYRGGKVMAFNNTSAMVGGGASFRVRDYGYDNMYTGFLNQLQTPRNYPLLDQIGVGQDETVSVTQISAGAFVGIVTPGDTNWAAIGASASTAGTWFFATGAGSGTGTVTRNSTNDPSYFWGNTKNGSAYTRTYSIMPAGPACTTDAAGYSIGATSITLASVGANLYAGNAVAFAGDNNRYLLTNSVTTGSNRVITIAAPGLQQAIVGAVSATINALAKYQYEQGSSSATFGDYNIIQPNRDFYASADFDSLTGVTSGLIANIGSAVGKTKQGYWATDEGSWNTENDTPGATGYQKGQGRFYVSNGTTWDLTYTPSTFPFGGAVPTDTSFNVERIVATRIRLG